MINNFKSHWDDFSHFAKTQQRGIVWLIIIISLFAFSGPLISATQPSIMPAVLSERERREIDKWYYQEENLASGEQHKKSNDIEASTFFPFNPNNATEEEFEKLGLNKGQIKSIIKLRAQFNGFKRKSDFEKLKMLEPQWVASAHAFILLPDSIERKQPFQKAFVVLDINEADSIALEKLPGIGEYMASKMVKMRLRLGGYISVGQMKDLTHMKPEIYNIVAPHLCVKTPVKSLYINSVPKEVLGQNPYIGWKAAKYIITYRSQHPIKNAAELVSAKILPDSSVQKLIPYLSF